MEIKQKFSWRSFISFGLLFSFLIIFFTGIILYLAPAGRIAHWVNWKLIALSKEDWQALHIIFSFLFVILSIFHLFSINWKVFLSYLKNKTTKGINKKRELLISGILTLSISIGVLYSIPPFSSVINLGESLTQSWENKVEQPPIPHAELLTLIELSEQLENFSIEKIQNKLKANNIKFSSSEQTLSEIAKINNLPPLDIYNIITKTSMTGMAGSGIGRKALEQVAEENGKDINTVLSILKKNNVTATKEQTLKDIAAENDMPARDIYELIK